jgi:hypothetical protein
MSERDKQFMSLYQKHRFENQSDFYNQTSKEFKATHRQVITLTGVIMRATVKALRGRGESPSSCLGSSARPENGNQRKRLQ